MFERIKDTKRSLFRWLSTKKGKRLKKALPSILMLALLSSIVLLTIFHSTDGFTTLVDTEPASIVTEKSSVTFKAYMLRDEMTVTSSYHGGVYYLADNAQRVMPGDEIAKVYSAPTDSEVKKLTDELDRYIDILEESIGDGHFTLGESKEVQNGISSLYYKMMRAVASGESSIISSSADELLILLNKMQSYSSNDTQKLQSLLDSYRNERNKLESYYKGDHQTLKAEMGGYFFRETDGYEGILTSADIDNLTYDSFFNMTELPRSEAETVGKILLNYKWYIAVPTVRGISDTFHAGSEYVMYFPDSGNRSFEMQLERIIYDSTESKSLMLFSCGTVDASFEYLRIQNVNIVNKNITGFRVPASAVCNVAGNSGVYILKDGRASFRKIVILYQGDSYYIVSSENTNSDGYYVYLELNDSIITNCENMFDGKVIE